MIFRILKIFDDCDLVILNLSNYGSSKGKIVGAKMLSVGIVMRTKNRSVLFKRALLSVANQTYSNWQLVVVNDGGATTEVDRLVEEVMGNHRDKCRVIHNADSVGMEAASNSGLAILDTHLGVIHDDDDSWLAEFLHTMVTAYQDAKVISPTVGGIVCHVNTVYETVEGNTITINQISDFNQWQKEGFLSLIEMLKGNFVPTIGFVFELDLCKQIGCFDASLPVLGDWDFNLRYLLKKDVWLISKTLAHYHHRVHSTGDVGNSIYFGREKHKNYRKFIENKYIREDVRLNQIGLGHMCLTTNLAQDSGRQIFLSLRKLRQHTKYKIIRFFVFGNLKKRYKAKLVELERG